MACGKTSASPDTAKPAVMRSTWRGLIARSTWHCDTCSFTCTLPGRWSFSLSQDTLQIPHCWEFIGKPTLEWLRKDMTMWLPIPNIAACKIATVTHFSPLKLSRCSPSSMTVTSHEDKGCHNTHFANRHSSYSKKGKSTVNVMKYLVNQFTALV